MGEMTFLEKYDGYVLDNTPTSKAEEIVFKMIYDLSDRNGLDALWDEFTDEVKEEIIRSWIKIVESTLPL